MSLFDLAGKTAIITGSSRGIGRAIAGQFAAHGANVVISSRNQDACDQAAAEINADHPGQAVAIAASISDKAALRALVEGARQAFGGIDILVCNAASNPHYGSLDTITDDQFRKIMDNNILANHWLIQMCAPDMIAKKNGSIIIVSSVGGLRGSDMIGAYNISKAADFQLARNYAVEYGRHNVRTNCIAPGLIRTEFARALWENPDNKAAFDKSHPMRRMGEAIDMAGPAVFLASEAAAYVNGQMIVADGGSTI